MNEYKWSKKEKSIARRAFENAYKKECREITEKARYKIKTTDDSNDLWQLHDFLTEKRREIDHKYDYRYSMLIHVFARLIKEGWINRSDLEGLSQDKIEKILHLANMLDSNCND
jgi:hypothetical protein